MLGLVRNLGVAVTRFPSISTIFNEKSANPCVSFSNTVMVAVVMFPV